MTEKKVVKKAASQLDYILKLGILMNRFTLSLKYLGPNTEIENTKQFCEELKQIKKEFNKLSPNTYRSFLHNDLYLQIKSNHNCFRELLNEGDKISVSIETYFMTLDVESFRDLPDSVRKLNKILSEMSVNLDAINKAYAYLNEKVYTLINKGR